MNFVNNVSQHNEELKNLRKLLYSQIKETEPKTKNEWIDILVKFWIQNITEFSVLVKNDSEVITKNFANKFFYDNSKQEKYCVSYIFNGFIKNFGQKISLHYITEVSTNNFYKISSGVKVPYYIQQSALYGTGTKNNVHIWVLDDFFYASLAALCNHDLVRFINMLNQ